MTDRTATERFINEIEEFIEMAIENENYPIDGTMAERLVKTMEK